MHKLVRALLGINVAAICRGLRLGFVQFRMAPGRAYEAVRPFESAALAGIPEREVSEIIEGNTPSVSLEVLKVESGGLPLEHVVPLLAILVWESPSAVLEIGTFMGYTTKAMALNLPKSKIHTIDLPTNADSNTAAEILPKDDFHLITERRVGREFKGTSCEERIVQHFHDTATWDFNEAAGASFFFVDGSHTYEYCKNDSEKCFELCNGKGVFLWHDCDDSHPGVVQFLYEWRKLGRDIVRIKGTSLAYWRSI